MCPFWEQHPMDRKSLANCQSYWISTLWIYLLPGKRRDRWETSSSVNREIHLLPLKINSAWGSSVCTGAGGIMIWCPREQPVSYCIAANQETDGFLNILRMGQVKTHASQGTNTWRAPHNDRESILAYYFSGIPNRASIISNSLHSLF